MEVRFSYTDSGEVPTTTHPVPSMSITGSVVSFGLTKVLPVKGELFPLGSVGDTRFLFLGSGV